MFTYAGKALRNLPLVAPPLYEEGQPYRKLRPKQIDNGTFVLPLKQSFIKDARIMPGTMRMLSLIAGWAGTRTPAVIETTQGILGKHLGRCTRQIYRYLQDAMEEGYLLYTRTADRLGYITGIKIWLNFSAIRRHTQAKKAKYPVKQDRTLRSDTNGKDLLLKEIEPGFRAKIVEICKRNAFDPPPLPA